ncbi:MAG: hypothetical protein NVS2B17_19830 [Candidatus Velthaea sp.]
MEAQISGLERPAPTEMKVQIFEPYFGGHYTEYVAHLLPSLNSLLKQGLIQNVVLTTSVQHISHPHFTDMIAPLSERLEIDAPFTIGEYGAHSGAEIAELLHQSVLRNKPDVVISTSADYGAFLLALRSMAARSYRFSGAQTIGVFHHGFARPAKGVRESVKDQIQRFARHYAPWSEIHFVNPLLYERVAREGRHARQRFHSLPHPVEQPAEIDKHRAREMLQIPSHGRYIGHVGSIDARMALPELITAFRAATSQPTDRILLAGKLYKPYQEYVAQSCRDLVDSGRLIVIDQYLTNEQVHVANCALDVAAITYYPAEQLSAKLLKAIVTRRPVITNTLGYTGMMVENFAVGESCDITDKAALAGAVSRMLAASGEYEVSPQTERLIQYHEPQNYANSVLASLYRKLGLSIPTTKDWEWVLAGKRARR